MPPQQHLFSLTRLIDLIVLKRSLMTSKDAAARNRLLGHNDPGKLWLSTDDFNRLFHQHHFADTLILDGLPLFDEL